MLKDRLFDLHISTIGREIFNKKVISVQFSSLNEGNVDIHIGHENMEWLLEKGKIIVTVRLNMLKEHLQAELNRKNISADDTFQENTKIFLNGMGVAKMQDNVLTIFAFPIVNNIKELTGYKDKYSQDCVTKLRKLENEHED